MYTHKKLVHFYDGDTNPVIKDISQLMRLKLDEKLLKKRIDSIHEYLFGEDHYP